MSESSEDELLDQLEEKTYATVYPQQLGNRGRWLVTIPEGVEPGDYIIIEISP